MDTTFCNLSLALAPGVVMTPRATSENLVRVALARVGDRPARVADVGTGSGALAVAIAVRAPEVEVWATDVNPIAVRLATENAERHGVGDRVHAVEASLLDGVPRDLDLVLANLPYLPERLRGQTAYDDEPWCAIYAAGDGLGHYRALLDAAEDHLAEDGAIAIQLHARVHAADRRRLEYLRATVERYAELAA
jgi:release factor glutamine methyltransferase